MQFFNPFLQAPNFEVVKTELPESGQGIFAGCKKQFRLVHGRSFLAAEAARDALFQDLNRDGWRSLGWLGDEQVDVVWHDCVAHQREIVTVTDQAKNLHKSIPGSDGAQERQVSIAGKGDEMQMPMSMAASEIMGHGVQQISKARPFETREWSATRRCQSRKKAKPVPRG
jgi:hypothetical protein